MKDTMQDPVNIQYKSFYNIDDFYRKVEAVIAGESNTQKDVLAQGALISKRQSYKIRKNRSYPRKSHRRVNKFQKE